MKKKNTSYFKLYYITHSRINQGVDLYIIRNLLRYIINAKYCISSSRRRMHAGAWWDTRAACRPWWYTPSFARRWYTKPAAWINKNRTFVGRQIYHIPAVNSRFFRILASQSRRRRVYHQCEALYIINTKCCISSSRRDTPSVMIYALRRWYTR